MKTHLLNSAVMPQPGRYRLTRIDADEFADLVKLAHRKSRLLPCIGYPQNAKIIRQLCNLNIPLSREISRLSAGDELLIMKLKYRLDRPDLKGLDVQESDFEFFKATFED